MAASLYYAHPAEPLHSDLHALMQASVETRASQPRQPAMAVKAMAVKPTIWSGHMKQAGLSRYCVVSLCFWWLWTNRSTLSARCSSSSETRWMDDRNDDCSMFTRRLRQVGLLPGVEDGALLLLLLLLGPSETGGGRCMGLRNDDARSLCATAVSGRTRSGACTSATRALAC